MYQPVVLPDREGSYLATVELWRRPDGSIAPKLVDMPKPVIESTGETASDRFRQLATWMVAAAGRIERIAEQFEGWEPDEEPA